MNRFRKELRVGLDLDGVIAEHSLGGFWVQARKMKEKALRKLHTQAYYYPKTSLEKNAWKVINWLRLPDEKGMKLAKQLKDEGWKFYLITGRFKFNYPRTVEWLKKYKLFDVFEKICFNAGDSDPTKFKAENIKKEKINFFIDDDLEVLSNLNGSGAELLWVVPKYRNGSENNDYHITTCGDLYEALEKIGKKIKKNIP